MACCMRRRGFLETSLFSVVLCLCSGSGTWATLPLRHLQGRSSREQDAQPAVSGGKTPSSSREDPLHKIHHLTRTLSGSTRDSDSTSTAYSEDGPETGSKGSNLSTSAACSLLLQGCTPRGRSAAGGPGLGFLARRPSRSESDPDGSTTTSSCAGSCTAGRGRGGGGGSSSSSLACTPCSVARMPKSPASTYSMATTPIANAYFPHLHELLESDETPDAPPYNAAFAQEAQLPAKVGRGQQQGRNSKAAALAEKEEDEENYISTGYMMPVRGPLKGPAALSQATVERSLPPLPVPGGGTTPRRRTSSGVRKSKAPKERGRNRRLRLPPRTAATDHVLSVEELGLRVDALLDRLAAADPESLSPRGRGPLCAEDGGDHTGDADWSSFEFEEGLLDKENDDDDELRQYLDGELRGRLNRQHDVFVRAFLEGSCSEQSLGPFSSEERDAAWRQLEEVSADLRSEQSGPCFSSEERDAAWRQLEEVSADLGRQLEAEMQRKNDDDMEEMEKAERRQYGEEFGTSECSYGSPSRSPSAFFSRAAAPTSPCSEALETLRRQVEGSSAMEEEKLLQLWKEQYLPPGSTTFATTSEKNAGVNAVDDNIKAESTPSPSPLRFPWNLPRVDVDCDDQERRKPATAASRKGSSSSACFGDSPGRRLEGAGAEAAVIGGEQKREEASARAQSAEVPAPRGGTVLPDETGRRGPERDGSSLFRLPMAMLRLLGRKAPRSQQQAFAALVEAGKAVARRLRRHFELETEIDLAHECCVCLSGVSGADQLLVACSSADPVSHWIHADCLQGKGSLPHCPLCRQPDFPRVRGKTSPLRTLRTAPEKQTMNRTTPAYYFSHEIETEKTEHFQGGGVVESSNSDDREGGDAPFAALFGVSANPAAEAFRPGKAPPPPSSSHVVPPGPPKPAAARPRAFLRGMAGSPEEEDGAGGCAPSAVPGGSTASTSTQEVDPAPPRPLTTTRLTRLQSDQSRLALLLQFLRLKKLRVGSPCREGDHENGSAAAEGARVRDAAIAAMYGVLLPTGPLAEYLFLAVEADRLTEEARPTPNATPEQRAEDAPRLAHRAELRAMMSEALRSLLSDTLPSATSLSLAVDARRLVGDAEERYQRVRSGLLAGSGLLDDPAGAGGQGPRDGEEQGHGRDREHEEAELLRAADADEPPESSVEVGVPRSRLPWPQWRPGPISLDAEPISLDFSPQRDDRGTHPALESRTASSPDNHPEDYAGAALQGELQAAEVEDVSMIDAGEDGEEDQHEERSAEELQASVARWADVAERMSRVFRDELAELHEDADDLVELQRDNVLWAYERTVAGYWRFQHWVSQLPVAQEVLVRAYLRLLLPMMLLHYAPSACADDSLCSLLTWGIVLLLVLAR